MSARGTRPLVVVGDALLDRDVEGVARRLCPDSPVPVLDDPATTARPGGAALTAHLAARAGHPVVLAVPVGADPVGAELLSLLDPGVRVLPLPWADAVAVKTRLRARGQTLLRVDRPARPYTGSPTAELADALREAGSILVSDYGVGVTHNAEIRRMLTDAGRRVPLVWDPHPRGAQCVTGTRLLTPNQAEAAAAAGLPELASARGQAVLAGARRAADRIRQSWPAAQVAVTLGAQGAVLSGPDGAMLVPAPSVVVPDPCGAGDCFAVTAATALCSGALPSEAVARAVVAAAEFLAAGGVAALAESGDRRNSPQRQPADAFALAAAVRSAGGRVVATGGCFDLLHAGHVRTLQTARAAGDCLIVCLNSDDSVRRLKGSGRPLNTAADRAAVLEALDCVDAVVVFDESGPNEVLRRLRPHVWVKGGDYSASSLPETDLVRSWNGEVLTVPYLAGRSTSGLVEAARLETG
ncbi:MAG: PfkB family carbohydrate kinase [Catenulispora sp.]